MTHGTLNAEFPLRVLKTEKDYADAKKFWQQRIAGPTCATKNIDSVIEYFEVLTLLMEKYEDQKIDDEFNGEEGETAADRLFARLRKGQAWRRLDACSQKPEER